MDAAPTSPPSTWEYELQFASGDAVRGPYDVLTLREMLYAGRLTGDERVRAPSTSTYLRLGDLPEFAQVLEITGRATRRRTGGWKVAPKETPAAETQAADPANKAKAAPGKEISNDRRGGASPLARLARSRIWILPERGEPRGDAHPRRGWIGVFLERPKKPKKPKKLPPPSNKSTAGRGPIIVTVVILVGFAAAAVWVWMTQL